MIVRSLRPSARGVSGGRACESKPAARSEMHCGSGAAVDAESADRCAWAAHIIFGDRASYWSP